MSLLANSLSLQIHELSMLVGTSNCDMSWLVGTRVVPASHMVPVFFCVAHCHLPQCGNLVC